MNNMRETQNPYIDELDLLPIAMNKRLVGHLQSLGRHLIWSEFFYRMSRNTLVAHCFSLKNAG
jgi:hypothetical protein